MGNIFTTIISLIVAILFTLIGLIATALPWMPEVHAALIKFLAEDTLYISLLGLTLFTIGIGATTYFIIHHSRRTYTIKKGRDSVAVDKKVLDGYIGEYFKAAFLNEEIPYQLILGKRGIHLSTELPYREKKDREPTAEKVYGDIIDMLEKKFDYQKELYLSVTFKTTVKREKIEC